MPTSDRPDWVLQAIKYFLAQDYPNLELIIVDASPDHRLAPLPDDSRIRRHRIPARSRIGTMRNMACDLANGEIVIHWDDDDWYAPTRVSAQVQPIVEGDADMTALHDTRFFELDSWRFWRCTPALHGRLFVRDVHGGTLAFRRPLRGANCRYPDISLGEDAWFLQRAIAQGARLRRISGASLFLYLRHGTNAWAFPCGSYLDPRGWCPGAPSSLAARRWAMESGAPLNAATRAECSAIQRSRSARPASVFESKNTTDC
jgi:O-antigen biosynthesis protein